MTRGENVSPLLPISSRVRCREILDTDIEQLVDLLTGGFLPSRGHAFWQCVFRRLKEHPTPEGFPKYGYLLEHGGRSVGVILLIFSAIERSQGTIIRCNVSSWYVEPAFRIYASMLISRALKDSSVTYLNITPAPHTLTMLPAQGYTRYCDGRVISLPALCTSQRGLRVEHVTSDIMPGEGLSEHEVDLLLRHQRYGCISLVGSSCDGRYPFVLEPRKKSGLIPFAFLVYCRSLESFVQFAGPIGRLLLRRGLLLVFVDANGAISGLPGIYSARNPKYFKGPCRPGLGDLAYTERPMFGV